MKSFVSRIWVTREIPKNCKFNVVTKINPDITLDALMEEFINTFVLDQDSESTNMVSLEFAKIYICCEYIEYTTKEMALVFSNKGAYDSYVEQTMRTVAEALKFINKNISDFIIDKYN